MEGEVVLGGLRINRKQPPPREPLSPPPPKRTREEAMREFEHACRAWFSCMLTPTERNDALQRAIEIANEIPFEPNRAPRSA